MQKSIVDQYYEAKQLADKYKKEADKLNKEIKEYMAEFNLNCVEGTDCRLILTESKSAKVDEDMLVFKLKSLGHDNLIKTVEVVDNNSLECAILDMKVNPNDLSNCYKINIITKLNIKKK